MGRNSMSYDKRYVAQKRQRRRRKTAKAKVKLYDKENYRTTSSPHWPKNS